MIGVALLTYMLVCRIDSSSPQPPALPNEGVGGFPVLKMAAQEAGSQALTLAWIYPGWWNGFVQAAGPTPSPGDMACECRKPPRGIKVTVTMPNSPSKTYVLYRLEDQPYFTGQGGGELVTGSAFAPENVQVLGWSY
ncbi:MAG: hypothetical protein U0575_00555 [Phycisphaerales bacterium]